MSDNQGLRRGSDRYAPRAPLPAAAREQLTRHLASLPDRLAHTLAVGDAAVEIDRWLRPAAGPEWVTAAYLHDIGYSPELVDTGLHQLDGARYVRSLGYSDQVCALIAWHSAAQFEIGRRGFTDQLLAEFPEPAGDQAEVLRLVSACDMTTSPTGQRIPFSERTRNIFARYPAEHPVAESMREAEAGLSVVVADAMQRVRLAQRHATRLPPPPHSTGPAPAPASAPAKRVEDADYPT